MKGKLGAERLAAYYADPVKAAERRQRARDLLLHPDTIRKAKAANRGCDVPPELEPEWNRLKREKRLSNREAAKALGLKFTGRRRKRTSKKRK